MLVKNRHTWKKGTTQEKESSPPGPTRNSRHRNPRTSRQENRPESALNYVLRADFSTRRFGPNESPRFPDVKNRDPGRFHGIRRQNRLKRFQIENDSKKRGYQSWQVASQTRLSGKLTFPTGERMGLRLTDAESAEASSESSDSVSTGN